MQLPLGLLDLQRGPELAGDEHALLAWRPQDGFKIRYRTPEGETGKRITP